MTDPEPGAASHDTRRERRAHRNRRRWRRTASVITGIVLFAGFALVATEAVRLGNVERPSLAGTVVETPTSSTARPSSTSTTAPGPRCRAPLTDADPLRLWIGGDSLAGSLGPELGAIAGATGVVQPRFDSRVSSGLTNPGFFDWPAHAAKEMPRLDPEVVVFIIGANDFSAPTRGTADDESGRPAWKADYTDRIEEMLAQFEGNGRMVIWVGSPAFNDSRNSSIKALDELAHEVVSQHPDVVYVDAYGLFTDADGEYRAELPPLGRPDDEPVLVRAGDGVHLTKQGGERLAQAAFAHIEARCKVTAQAVAGVVKPTIQTEGSTLVVGGTDRAGGTVQTSPPASSAPPATTPPTPTTTAPSTASTTAPATTTTAPVSTTTTVPN